ncbi:desmethyl-deoxy-podophyllotoxin synthase-like [Lolium rigidum]|uniref:desmethyl-deoxy-podophyllotoxin synthase-like n=1 Tax=Lolium rigidum TaxID=89674 RepID=UPI001F5DF13D|nr:desmethyl-deoxy-podophyllotoxin synthase-like [Lolium rigidum]
MAQDVEYSYHHYLLLAAIVVLPLLLAKLRPRRHGGGETNLPPGPWRLPVIGSLHHLVGALPHRAMRDLARRHGAPLMLLHLGELKVVVASSAAAAREVMRTHDAALATRPRTATIRALTRDGVGVAFAPQGEHWRQLRKLCVTELLGARRVRSLRGSREAEAASLVASVASAASSSAPVNVSALLATYVTDAVVRAVVGDRIGNRDAFLECLDEGVKVAAGFSLADLFPSSRLARAFSGAARRAELHGVKMSRLMNGVIEEHRARRKSAAGAGDDEEDLLDVLLRIQTYGGHHVPLDIGTIRAVITDLFGAGSETSATTLQWAMAELMREPRALHRAQAEVRGALAGEGRVREEALPEMRYLQLVLKETLRLHPAVPLLLPRECQEPCRDVLGNDVPVGAMVLVNAWAIGRDVESWGADAEEFKPERFEEAVSCAVDFRGTDFELVPFGAGRRMCPGIALGLAIMEVALASLLFHFDWELPGDAAPRELDMTEALGITARRKGDLWLHASLRVPLPSL